MHETQIDAATGSGLVVLTATSVLQFLDIHSGGIVALCAIGGLICTIIGMVRKTKKTSTRQGKKKRR